MQPHFHTISPASIEVLNGSRHPLVAQACAVSTPTTRPRTPAPWSASDPDRLVVLSCLASFLVMPFLL